jgi:hypothetical protein
VQVRGYLLDVLLMQPALLSRPAACVREAARRAIKLVVHDLVNQCNASDRDGCMVEAREPQHRPHSLFHATVVLLNDIVHIAVGPYSKITWQDIHCL